MIASNESANPDGPAFDPAAFADVPAAARALAAAGVRPVVVEAGEKRPAMNDWPKHGADVVVGILEKFPAYNVGGMLGTLSGGLLDIDLDTHWARQIMPRLLERFVGECPCFGRIGRAAGHYLVRATDADPGETAMWCLSEKEAAAIGLTADGGGKKKRMIAELRGTGGQSVFPPSRFDDGGRVAWVRGGKVPSAPRVELERLVALCAALSVIAYKYPKSDGNRNEVYLALTGAMVPCEWMDDEDVEWCVDLVAGLANDEKRKGRAAETRAKIEADEEAWGLTKLVELLDLGPAEKPIRKWLTWGQKRKKRLDKPPPDAIALVPGELNRVIDEATAAMVRGRTPIYARDRKLVRVLRIDRKTQDASGITRHPGSTIIEDAGAHWTMQQLGRVAKFAKFDGRSGWGLVDPPVDAHAHLAARIGDGSPFPVLRAVYNAPTMRPDGTILQNPGYDAATGILYEPAAEFPVVAENPTLDDARRAIEALIDPFRMFPFVADADGQDVLRSASMSVVLSGILCLLSRDAMRCVPMHLLNAHEAGSGKSLLSNTIATIGTGAMPASFDHGPDAVEFEKRMGSTMLAGDRCILIDNIDGEIGGSFICGTLTAEVVKVRVLGVSKQVTIPNTFTVFGNGNNVTPVGDLTRRCVRATIDPGMAEPDTRKFFTFDPAAMAMERRAELVHAGLTILRAYVVAGRPLPAAFEPMGSFEDYSLVRGALIELGFADPLDTRRELRTTDPRKALLAQLLEGLRALYGPHPFTVSELHERVGREPSSHLFQLLTNGQPVFNVQSVGRRLQINLGKRAAGLALVRGGDHNHAATWRVVAPGDAAAQLLIAGFGGAPQ